MGKPHSLLLLVAVVITACATTTPPAFRSPRRSAGEPASADENDMQSPANAPAPHDDPAAIRKDLVEAYAEIVAREKTPVALPVVDVEAAASMAIPDHRTIRGALNLFTTDLRPDIQAYLTRSAKYKKLIDKALADANLPKGLAYLPVIESGYSPTLTSRAGAHGIWQFMGDTARDYGLRVDWWVDERADPEKSTRAATVFLKDLYREFGDWPLALAAYNAGPGRIRHALAETGASTFWELCNLAAIPKETGGYVPTFYATLIIASDPATYGFRLDTPLDSDAKRIELEGPLSLKYLADVARLDEAILRNLNPAYRRAVLPPGRSAVRLPAKAIELIADRATTLKNEDAEIAICSFTLRSGDTLKRLARAIGTKVETILAMNDLSSPARASKGDSIYLPVRARDLGTLLAHSEDETIYYAVRKGDTLDSIARRHNLTVAELRELNDLRRGEKLRRGQKLRVSPPRTVTAGGM